MGEKKRHKTYFTKYFFEQNIKLINQQHMLSRTLVLLSAEPTYRGEAHMNCMHTKFLQKKPNASAQGISKA